MSESREPTGAPRTTATYARPADGGVVTVDLHQAWVQLVPASSEGARVTAYTADSVEAALAVALNLAVGQVELTDTMLLRALRLLDQFHRQAAGPDYTRSPFGREVRTTIDALQLMTGWQTDQGDADAPS